METFAPGRLQAGGEEDVNQPAHLHGRRVLESTQTSPLTLNTEVITVV